MRNLGKMHCLIYLSINLTLFFCSCNTFLFFFFNRYIYFYLLTLLSCELGYPRCACRQCSSAESKQAISLFSRSIPVDFCGRFSQHSPRTPLCAKRFEKIFLKAGLPEGVVTAIQTDIVTTNQLLVNPLVAFLLS
jgi:hypothetical protein